MPKGRLTMLGWPWRFVSRSKASTTTKPKNSPMTMPATGVSNDGNYAHLYSGNILYDPGVELFVGNAVGFWSIHKWKDHTGNRTFMLPNFDALCEYWQRWPNTDCVTYWDIAQWVSVGSGYTPNGGIDTVSWNVTRADPYLGDFSMSWWRWSEGPGGNPMSLMVQAPGLPGGYSARVESGDRVTFSVRSKMYPNLPFADDCQPKISVMLYYYNKAGSTIVGGGNYYQTLTLTYAQFLYDTIAPSGAYFVRALCAFTASNPSTLTLANDPSVLVDSGVLSVE